MRQIVVSGKGGPDARAVVVIPQHDIKRNIAFRHDIGQRRIFICFAIEGHIAGNKHDVRARVVRRQAQQGCRKIGVHIDAAKRHLSGRHDVHTGNLGDYHGHAVSPRD